MPYTKGGKSRSESYKVEYDNQGRQTLGVGLIYWSLD